MPSSKIDHMIQDMLNSSLSDIIGADFLNTQAASNIIDMDKSYVIELAAPGLKKADFDIQMEKQVLSIAVHKESNTQEDTVDYKRREFSYKKFKRRYRLPDTLDLNTVHAQYKNGLLRIEFDKKEKDNSTQNRSIKIS